MTIDEVQIALLRIGYSGSKADRGTLSLNETIFDLPLEVRAKIEMSYFFSVVVDLILSTPILSTNERKRRSRENRNGRNQPGLPKGAPVPARSHHRSALIWYLMFGNGLNFDYDRPKVAQWDAAEIVAKILLGLKLEIPRLKPSFSEKSDAAKEHERIRILAENLSSAFRLWNCRQLPGLPRGTYASWSTAKTKPGLFISSDSTEVARSQYKMPIEALRKKGLLNPVGH